jgi:hypothetical protein
MTMKDQELNFGPGKYAALGLMLARWLRTESAPSETYNYVTLGGTELFDVANINWIDRDLIDSVVSYEHNKPQFRLAKETASRFKSKGISVEILNDDIFQYRRRPDDEKPHVYYVDVTGVFWRRPYQAEFKTWFDREVIRPGDLILITSYLGFRIPMKARLPEFDAEFLKLRISSADEKARVYETLHPLFVLSRALIDAGLSDEIKLRCLGCIKYRANRERMGLYGMVCESGKAQLAFMSSRVPCFDMIARDWYELPEAP